MRMRAFSATVPCEVFPTSRPCPKSTQLAPKIDPKWYHLASKKRPKWYLSDPEVSNLPYNRFYDSELGSWRSLRPPNPPQFASKILLKSIMKALCLTNSKQAAFWNGSGASWTSILKCFLKYLRGKILHESICKDLGRVKASFKSIPLQLYFEFRASFWHWLAQQFQNNFEEEHF